jgi:hypothetical protein
VAVAVLEIAKGQVLSLRLDCKLRRVDYCIEEQEDIEFEEVGIELVGSYYSDIVVGVIEELDTEVGFLSGVEYCSFLDSLMGIGFGEVEEVLRAGPRAGVCNVLEAEIVEEGVLHCLVEGSWANGSCLELCMKEQRIGCLNLSMGIAREDSYFSIE